MNDRSNELRDIGEKSGIFVRLDPNVNTNSQLLILKKYFDDLIQCKECGFLNGKGSSYCQECGLKLAKDDLNNGV